jgi:hypothetical protein
MSKKKLIILANAALVALLVAGLAGATLVSAQGPTPTSPPVVPFGGRGWGGGFGFGRGVCVCGQAGLEAAAKALNMTADDLSAQLWSGRTLADLADKAGVNLKTVRDAVDAACKALPPG